MIFLITGLMASGKSTVAQLLAQSLPRAVHLRGDTFRRMVVSGREDMSGTPSKEAICQLNMRYRLTAIVAKEYHSAGFDVVVQDNYYGDALSCIMGMLEPERVCVTVLCPSIDIIRQREALRDKKGYTGFTIDALYNAFMSETPRIGLWLDNGELTPRQTAERILNEAHP